MSNLPADTKAQLSIEGDAETIIRTLGNLPKDGISTAINIHTYVKAVGFSGRDLYVIPAIRNGDTGAAEKIIEGLFNQGRIDVHAHNALMDALSRIRIALR